MNKLKENSKYKSIGEVAEILELINKKKDLYQHIRLDFGKKNLNKSNQKYLLVEEGIMIKKQLRY